MKKKKRPVKAVKAASKSKGGVESAFDKPEIPAVSGVALLVAGAILLLLYQKVTEMYTNDTIAANVLFFSLLAAGFLSVVCAITILVAIIRKNLTLKR